MTLYGKWIINKYTVKFDLGNGEVIERTFNYNETIDYPEDPVRAGYTFSKWNSTLDKMPAENLTVKALWAEEVSFVKVTLGTADLSEEEVIELIKKYTDSDFTIDNLETDTSGGSTQVIIRFGDSEEADKFIEKVKDKIKGGEDDYLRGASAVQQGSYSCGLDPVFIGSLFFF